MVLVILPTAVLSIMSARMISGWEAVLKRRLERRAEDTLRDAAGRIRARLHDDLVEIQSALGDCVRNRGTLDEIGGVADRVCAARPLVGNVYLFMNPWGFIYPEQKERPGADSAAAEPDVAVGTADAAVTAGEALRAGLRRAIAEAGSLNVTVKLTVDNRAYCFAPLPERRELYVGYQVDAAAFQTQLVAVLDAYAGSGFTLTAEGPGIALPSRLVPRKGRVLMTDSLSPIPRETKAPREPGDAWSRSREDGGAPVATGRLDAPFDAVKLAAYTDDPRQIRRTGAVQARLYVLGVVILAGGIVAGLSLVMWEAAAQIRQARSRSDFVVGVSHDLRTPVASMKVLAETLYLGHVDNPEKQKTFLATIVKECERLHQLTERVLFFVRFGQDALVYTRVEEHSEGMVRSAVDAFRARYSLDDGSPGAAAVDLRFSVGDGLPGVQVDRSAMGQVILNLLDNAAKYGRGDDAAPCRIDVSVERVLRKRFVLSRMRPWLRIAVCDRGGGMNARDLRRVFRRYYRGPGADDRNVSGVGLGLALSRHVVIAHGGWIEASSRPGEGCCFSVYLPAIV